MVSAVASTYNRASFLPRVWRSLKVQKEPNFEWIIVDDASTDNTPEIIEQLQKEDERIRYIRLAENRGVNFARARGIEEARAPYLVFLDSDDILYDCHTLAVILGEIPQTPDGIAEVLWFYSVSRGARRWLFHAVWHL